MSKERRKKSRSGKVPDEDKHIPLSEAEKTLLAQYTSRISNLRESLNDLLGVMMAARELSPKEFIIDMQRMEIRSRREDEK